YESVKQYAQERLGISLSSLEHRMLLAERARAYPDLGRAIEQGAIGYEAALLVGRVLGRSANRELARQWIERAGARTIKHLREDARAVLLAVAYDPEISRRPPSDEDVEAVAAFETKVQSGELLRSYYSATVAPPPQMSVGLEIESASPAEGRRP